MSEKRVCVYCKRPMFNSLESVWVCGKNYDIHKKCKTKHETWLRKRMTEKQAGEKK